MFELSSNAVNSVRNEVEICQVDAEVVLVLEWGGVGSMEA